MAGEQIEVEISDQGPGLAEEEQKRVFEPFYTTKDHGLGLGLSICSTIVRSHAGKIRLSGDASGTAVVIALPIASPSKLASAI
jgi:signal transduction histidine kinase